MTREEAIEILKKLIEAMQGHVTVLPTPERVAAIRLAIASLETDEAYQLEYENPTTKNNLGVDCISRKAVLDAIDSKAWEFCDYLISKGRNDEQKPVSHFADNLRECVREDLPSVTPQEPQTFKWCTDCKEYDQEKHCCHRWSKAIRDTVEEMKQEYIERDVFDKIRAEIERQEKWLMDAGYNQYNVDIALDAIKSVVDKYKAETEDT